MQIATFQYTLKTDSWSVGNLPPLDSSQTLVLAFGATEIQTSPKILQLIQSHYPTSHILGCSTAGEVLDGRLADGTLAVAVIRFDSTMLESASVVVREPSQSREAGRTLGSQLVANGAPDGIILLAEGLRLDHPAFLAGLQEHIGSVPVIGALAADSQRYEASWVWAGQRLQSGLVGAVALRGGGLSIHAVVNETWGAEDNSERVITKAIENVVFSIGGIPATDLCSGPSGLLPLRVLGANNTSWFASPLGANAGEKSVVFNRVVPAGSRVQIVHAEHAHLIAGAGFVAQAASELAAGLERQGSHGFAIATSSAGRRLFLGDQAQAEITSLIRGLPADLPHIGLYSYGEVSPNAADVPELHDAGLGLMLISERGEATLQERPRKKSPTIPATPRNRPSRATGSRTESRVSGSAVTAAGQAKFINAQTTSSMVQMRPTTIEMEASRASCYDLGRLKFISLSGTINETFRGAEVAAKMSGRVVLDLGGVDLVTSYGVRQWLEMLSAIEQNGVTQLYLAQCSEAIVNQMLMIRNFKGRGQVVSFGAPYICTACSTTFEYVLDCEHSAEEISAASPHDVACANCGNRAVFDEDPDLYLEFVRDDVGKALPFDVRNALAERRLEAMTEVDEAIEKRVEGDRTVFRINREVDEKVRWKRVLSGVEGIIRLDFARSKGATDVGADRFLNTLRQQTDAVTQIILDQLPANIVQRMLNTEPLTKVLVRTITLPARCSNCGVVRQAAVDPAGIRDAARRGLQPESECRRCSGSVPIALSPEIIAFFSGSAQPRLSGGLSGGRGLSPLVWGAIAVAVILAIVIVMLATK